MSFVDCHVHSSFSPGSTITPEAGSEIALKRGLAGLAFADHLELDPKFAEYDCNFDFKKRLQSIEALQKTYANRLKILAGVEIGIQPNTVEAAAATIQENDLDFVINSVHVIDRIDLGRDEFYHGKTQREAYRRYFEEVLASITNFKNYDVIGHLGYIRKYGGFENHDMHYAEYADIIDVILKKVIADDKGIEINTSGYRKSFGAPLPDFDIVQRYIDLGGEIITLGSDAHVPEHIGECFDIVSEKLKDMSIMRVAYFENRKPVFLEL